MSSFLQELTLADRFMVGVYSFIFASFIVTIVMLRLQRENYYYFADIFYSYTEWMVRATYFWRRLHGKLLNVFRPYVDKCKLVYVNDREPV